MFHTHIHTCSHTHIHSYTGYEWFGFIQFWHHQKHRFKSACMWVFVRVCLCVCECECAENMHDITWIALHHSWLVVHQSSMDFVCAWHLKCFDIFALARAHSLTHTHTYENTQAGCQAGRRAHLYGVIPAVMQENWNKNHDKWTWHIYKGFAFFRRIVGKCGCMCEYLKYVCVELSFLWLDMQISRILYLYVPN